MTRLSKITIIVLIITILFIIIQKVYAADTDCEVDLTNLKYIVNGIENSIKNYTQDDYDQFVSDFSANSLPIIYTTDFLYDGVGMVKTPDLDDFIEANSNDTKVKTLSIKAINVNTTGNIKFSGEINSRNDCSRYK